MIHASLEEAIHRFRPDAEEFEYGEQYCEMKR